MYYLSRIMTEKTDDGHALDMSEMQRYLEEYGVIEPAFNLFKTDLNK